MKMTGRQRHFIQESAVEGEQSEGPFARWFIAGAKHVDPRNLVKCAIRGNHIGRIADPLLWIADTNGDDAAAEVTLNPDPISERLTVTTSQDKEESD